MVGEIYDSSPQHFSPVLLFSLNARCAPDARWGLKKTKRHFVTLHNCHLQSER